MGGNGRECFFLLEELFVGGGLRAVNSPYRLDIGVSGPEVLIL